MDPEIHLSASHERRSSSWDIKNALGNYTSLVLAQGGSAFFAFASIWLLTRGIGTAGYGTVVAIIAASQTAQILVNWTSTAVIRFGVDEFVETGKIAQSFWLRLFILVPNLVLIWLAAPLWFPPLANWLKLSPDILWLVILHFVIATIWIHIQYSLQAVKMPRVQGWLLTLERISIFLSLLIFSLTGLLEPRLALIGYAAAPLLPILAGVWFLRKFIFAARVFDRALLGKILVFSVPLLPYTLTAFLSGGYADALFVSKYLSTHDLGIYSVATQVGGLTLQLPTLANTLLLPLFLSLQKEGGMDRLKRYFKHVLPSLILIWGVFVTVLALAGYFFVPLVFGHDFFASVQPIWIFLGGSTLALPPLLGYVSLSTATSKTYMFTITAAVAGVTNIVFDFLLIPAWGIEGGAWATTIMYFLTAVAHVILLRRVMTLPLGWIAAAVLPGVAGAVTMSLTGHPWLSFGICICLSFSVGYFCRSSIKDTISFFRTVTGAKSR